MNEALSSSEQEEWQSMKAELRSEKSYAALRSKQQRAPPPVIPYVGMFLQDLVFIEDGNPTFISNQQQQPPLQQVNYRKFSMVSRIISEITQYQRIQHSFESWPELSMFISNLQPLSDIDLNE